MTDVTTLETPNETTTGRIIHHSSGSRAEEANRNSRKLIILCLAFEFAFLATLAAYEFSSIFRFQN
jgi:hypothetical protein